MPDVPTASETGGSLQQLHIASWNALAAPAKTPRDIVVRLNRELQAALGSADLRKKLAELDVDAASSTPEQLGGLLASDIKRWSGVIERAKIPKQ